jgi:hypothetical protein
MADDPTLNTTIDDQIAYHKDMEHLANKAKDFTLAEHHRNMQEILESMKKSAQLQKTPEQISDEDYKVAPTSADKEKMSEEHETEYRP